VAEDASQVQEIDHRKVLQEIGDELIERLPKAGIQFVLLMSTKDKHGVIHSHRASAMHAAELDHWILKLIRGK